MEWGIDILRDSFGTGDLIIYNATNVNEVNGL